MYYFFLTNIMYNNCLDINYYIHITIFFWNLNKKLSIDFSINRLGYFIWDLFLIALFKGDY